MGSYSSCWFGDFQVEWSKNDVDPALIRLFRESDKRVVTDPVECVPEKLKHYKKSLVENAGYQIVYYEASAFLIKDRLDVMGYTLGTAKEAFLEWIKEEKKNLYGLIAEINDDGQEVNLIFRGHLEQKLKIISDLMPDRWIETVMKIRQSNFETKRRDDYIGPHEDTLINYMLAEEQYGFPGVDIFVLLRLLLETASPNEKIIYDITDLVWSGYFDSNDDLVEDGLRFAAWEYSTFAKTIILTEGIIDTWVLKETLDIMYPHLADYFSFLEYDNAKIGGGVGNLVNMVKAFAGAGVVNNIIALFDNDTAAEAAIGNIGKINLPENIRILKLPELDILKNYPTIGPSGNVMLNVNGIAASIELYFGEDVLKVAENDFAPIQWTGYDAGVKKYQGEVTEKKLLQTRFKEKLAIAKLGNNSSFDSTWDSIRSILKLILFAFEDRNKKNICDFAKDYYAR